LLEKGHFVARGLVRGGGCRLPGRRWLRLRRPEPAVRRDFLKSHKAKTAAAPGKPGEVSLGEMVAAVSNSKGPPVELKFSVPVRPEVGQATEIDVALIPSQPLPDSVSISFQVVDGLDIVDGSQMERVDKLTAGTPIRHVLKVLPKRDGIFALTAVVSYTASNQEMNRMFSIPVIAGVGLTDQVAKGP